MSAIRFAFTRFLAAAALAALINIPTHSQADVLGGTHVDFSTAAQGTAGIQYGYYTAPDSLTAPFDMTGMVVGDRGFGPIWEANPNGSTCPNFYRNSQHPGQEPGLQPAVRRYVVNAAGEPSYTGTVRIVGRYFDLNGGSNNVFVAVDPDGDGGAAPRGFALASTPLAGPQPVEFDVTAEVSPNSTIDFGVLPMGSYNSDSVGLAAWVVTGDTAVPTNVVANNYSSTNQPFGGGSVDARVRLLPRD